MPRIGTLVLALACLCALALPTAAPAAIRAKTTVETKSGATRLVVKLTSTRALTARTRPRTVKVKRGRAVYRLSRVRGSSAAAVSAGVWRSAAYRGRAASPLKALVGKGVKVLVTSLAGTATLSNVATNPTIPTTPPAVTPPTTGSTPPPASRPGEIGGEEGKRQFHQALIDHMLRWTNRPTGYDAAETWGFCVTDVYQRYVSSTLDPAAWQTQHYNYTVTAGLVHPAAIPQAELLGQIQLSNGDGYNIAFAYGRQSGAWAKVGSSTDYPFTVSGYTCGQELPN